MDPVDMELDLELDAELEAEINRLPPPPATDTESEIKTDEPLLVGDEDIDRFEALPRPSKLFLHGVDEMSTDDITTYVNNPLVTKVEWINDSSCNLACASAEDALTVASTLLPTPERAQALDHRTLVPAKPFTPKEAEQKGVIALFIRVSTDEDVKERGARERSRYYLLHGNKDQPVTKERREARREHIERMQKNGGDGRDVFSRLGNKVPSRHRSRSRSRSPERDTQRTIKARNREVPDRLKSRLGPIKAEESEIKQED